MVGNKGYQRKFGLRNFYGNALQVILIGCIATAFYLPLQAADTSAVNALELARSYQDNRQFSEAEQEYTRIISSYPQTDYAFTAYNELALLQIDLEAAPAAETTRQGLMQDFANHPDISQAVTHIGDAWRQKGYHTKAIAIYNDVTSRWPNEGYAMWSAMGRAICYAYQEDDAAAQAEVDGMITAFAEQQGLAQAVSSVGDAYRKLEKWEKSRTHYRYVMENHPKEQIALWSGMGLAIASVRLNDLETAAQSTESLLAYFPEDTRLSNAACQIADEYRRIQKYEAACPLYQYVLDNFPEAEFALWSRMGLAIANVRTRNQETAAYVAARSAERLLADFPGDPRMNYAVGQIADTYRQAKQYEAACPLYQYVVDNFPESGYALWSRMGLAIANVRMKNLEAAAGSVTRLLADFPEDPRLPSAVHQIANEYCRAGQYEAARTLCQSMIENDLSGNHAVLGRAELGAVHVWLGEVQTAESILVAIVTEYANHPNLPQAVSMMAVGYYSKAFTLENQGNGQLAFDYFRKAIEKWEMVTQDLPETPDITAEAYKLAADCYRRMGNYQKAIEYYQEVTARWPKYQYAWHAQYLVGYSYERLKKARSLPVEEANAKIQIAYERLLQNYPDCSTAKVAHRWLNRRSQDKENIDETRIIF